MELLAMLALLVLLAGCPAAGAVAPAAARHRALLGTAAANPVLVMTSKGKSLWHVRTKHSTPPPLANHHLPSPCSQAGPA
jgi:hypothetical protein